MTLASETPVQYFYDAANRLTNVVQGTLTASLSYDDAGRRTKLVVPNPPVAGQVASMSCIPMMPHRVSQTLPIRVR